MSESLKQVAGEKAVETAVSPHMVIGLGTGSTAVYATRKIGQLWQAGALPGIVAIPTSEATAAEARQFNIPLTSLDAHPVVDVVIDGADEIDPQLNLIKGLGGALLREKIVATAAKQMIVVADASKKVAQLGERVPLPVEVVPFATRPCTDYLQQLGATVELRTNADGRPYLTDEKNHILHCFFGAMDDPVALGQAIRQQPGVVEHGLFLGLASTVILATAEGIELYDRPL